MLADGLTWAEIRAKLDCSDSYIEKRFGQSEARVVMPLAEISPTFSASGNLLRL